MYDFHYNFLKKNSDVELLFTNTHSLTYEIKSEIVYEKFFKWKDLFDFSNYSKDSNFLIKLMKNLLAKRKMNLVELLLLNSMKKIHGNKECNTVKGVSIATEFGKFKDVSFNEKTIRHKMKRIQSKRHKLGTSETDKISLSCFDDKRYMLDDGIRTLAYFHKGSDN